jgi:short-subunit dehydrogenase
MISQHQTAIVTGASRGVGPHIARALAARGIQVVLAARCVLELDRVARTIADAGGRAFPVGTDVADPQALRRLVDEAQRLAGPIDIVVNNAGGDLQREFHQLRLDDIDITVRLNLTSAIELTRLALPSMLRRRRGHIVNISSLAGWVSFPHTEAYAAAKHGLLAFTRVFRADYRARGISASTLILSAVLGDGLGERTLVELGVKPSMMAKRTAISPEDVARAVVRAIEHDQGEVVVGRGPAGLLRHILDLFPSLGPHMNAKVGITELMNRVADLRQRQAGTSESVGLSTSTDDPSPT